MFLSRARVPPDESVVRKVRRVTYWGMAVNIAIALLKGIGGVLCASQALVADAIHSLSDLMTDIAVILGVRYWSAPADEDHPYGHGKIEALVTLFIALALVLVAWELGWHAVDSLRARKLSVPQHGAALLAAVSVVAKEILFRATRRVARAVKSPALEANAWHHRSDALSSIPVALAVAVAHFFPSLAWVDLVAALLVSLFLVHISWQLAKPALQELIDASMEDKAKAVEERVRTVPGVLSVHKVRARRYGGSFFVDLHIRVEPSLTVSEGHRLGHDVQDALLASDLAVADAVVHVEPQQTGREND